MYDSSQADRLIRYDVHVQLECLTKCDSSLYTGPASFFLPLFILLWVKALETCHIEVISQQHFEYNPNVWCKQSETNLVCCNELNLVCLSVEYQKGAKSYNFTDIMLFTDYLH